MICLKLLLLLLVVVVVRSGNRYLIIVTRNERGMNGMKIYQTDSNLGNPIQILSGSAETPLHNFFIKSNDNGFTLLWSHEDKKGFSYFHRTNNVSGARVGVAMGGRNPVFLGPGSNGKIFAYCREDKEVHVTRIKQFAFLTQLKKLKNIDIDMDCVTRHPNKQGLLLFSADCSKPTKFSYVYNLETDSILNKTSLSECFDMWRIMPNDNKVIAVKGDRIYKSENDQGFIEIYKIGPKVIDISLGDNEIFLLTDETPRKILRIDLKLPKIEPKHIRLLEKVEGQITKIIVYQELVKDRYLIFASEDDKSGRTIIYKSDFNLHNPTKLFTTGKKVDPTPLVNLFINRTESEDALFWIHKDSNKIGYFDITKTESKFILLRNASKGVFLGPGNHGKMYFYFPETKQIQVYDNNGNSNGQAWIGEGSLQVVSDMHCMTRDPCRQEWVLYAQCASNGTYYSHGFDIETPKILKTNTMNKCFDTWRIMPSVEKVFAVKDSVIYEAPYILNKEIQAFEEFANVGQKIVGFAVGNDEMFYSTEESGKIYHFSKLKLNSKNPKAISHEVEGKVKVLAVYQNEPGITTRC